MDKRGLYLIFEDEDELKKNAPGIYKKILHQMDVFHAYDLDVVGHFLAPQKTFVEKLSKRLPYNIGGKRIKLQDDGHIDFVYIRRPQLNYTIYHFLRQLKTQYNCKIIWEIPTYPYDEECETTIKNYIVHYKDKKYRQKLRGLVDVIVTFSKDEFIWDIATLPIANGIDVEKMNVVAPKEIADIQMIAVASFHYWHGYDRLIKGLAAFKRRHPEKMARILLHLVGDGPALSEYRQLVKALNLTEHVIFYGHVYGEQLDTVYNQATLGIDALGRHRSGVYYNSSLKGKEYCAKGLPVVSGVTTELDEQSNFPYYLRFPADDTPINIQTIVDFHEEVYRHGQKKVVEDIRAIAEEHFDLVKTLAPIVTYIQLNE